MLLDFINILLWLVGIYLLLNCSYLAFFAIIALFKVPKIEIQNNQIFLKTVILFPTYQENYIILDSVKDALAHQYNGYFEVAVIADGLETETLDSLKAMGARVIEVQFEKSTKGKALHYAINMLKDENFEMAVVLDVDNEMQVGCLNAMNLYLTNEYKVAQAHRVAKNKDSNFAFLDACNEEINNQIYRKGPAVLGMSSSLIGSGIAFNFDFYKQLLEQVGDTVGEDKQLDFIIAKEREKVAYLDDVRVYDEKIQDVKVFTKQRTRWIASQIEFTKKYGIEGFKQLFNGNIEFFNKTLQTFLVPRMLLLGILFIFTVQSIFNPLGPEFIFSFSLFLSLCLTLLISVPLKFYKDKRLYFAVLQIPRAILGMFIALINIGKSKKSFLATPHSYKEKKE